jgi:hypothetical protein
MGVGVGIGLFFSQPENTRLAKNKKDIKIRIFILVDLR